MTIQPERIPAELHLSIAEWTSKLNPVGKARTVSWSKLRERLQRFDVRSEKDGPAWSPAEFQQDPPQRKAVNVVSLSALVIDCDSGAAIETVRERIGARRLEAVIHGTHSSRPEALRGRVVLPLAQPVPAERWSSFWDRAMAELAGGSQDPACRDPSRLYWWPATSSAEFGWSEYREGLALDPSLYLPPQVAALVAAALRRAEGRNAAGMWLACQLRDNGYSVVEAQRAGWDEQVPREKPRAAGGVDVYTTSEWLATVEKVYRRPAREPWTAGKNGSESTTDTTKGTSVVSVVTPRQEKGPKEPENLEPEAYHGLPGRVMRAIAPHTESHAAGILGSFLTGGGCLIGPRPHVFRDGQRHGCNEFALLVGKTGSGRKGSATRRVDELFRNVSSSNNTSQYDIPRFHEHAHEGEEPFGWLDMVLRGLGSGEALVAALAEEQGSGEIDGRRMVFEQEFARCLKVMARDYSTLSEMLRSAWDSEPMEVRTKARTLKASQSHVSILAHVTEADLRERMAQTDLFNGFANRFLWLSTRRVRSLPFGGGDVTLTPLTQEIHTALQAIRTARLEFDEDAAWIWEHGGIYDLLSSGAPGLLGAVTDRAAAHVTRIALQYAVWDRASAMGVPHLLAGLAVWDYSEKTCAALFGRSTGDGYADLILEKLREVDPGWLTRKEIRDLFSRNAAPGRIPTALDLLEERGLIERKKMETEGRSAEIILLSLSGAYDRYDRSPLEVAREHAKERGYTTETTEVE